MLGSPENGVPVLLTTAGRRRRLLMPLFIACVVAAVALLLTGHGQETQIQGAGSTLAQPLIERSTAAFRQAQNADDPERPAETGNDWVLDGSGIEYEPVGSLGGIMRLSNPEVDFAISDYAIPAEDLDELEVVQFPIMLGAVSVVHSLDLPKERDLRLDAATLASIYLGDITRWDDPAVLELNPGLALPDLEISVVHRSDGSGSTKGFTGYLDAGSTAWSAGPGTSTEVDWPAGSGVERSRGLIDAVQDTPGSIGYVEQGQALRAGLGIVALGNEAGGFVAPSRAALLAAVSEIDWSGSDGYVTPPTMAPVEETYPITVAVYALVRSDPDYESQSDRTLSYLRFLLEDFDAEAEDLGYVALPDPAAKAIRAFWASALPHAA